MQQAGKLNLCVPGERELKGGQTDVYTVDAKVGEFLHVIAEQKGIDVVMTITDSGGNTLIEADSPNGSHGLVPAAVLCPVTGAYSVRVSSLLAQGLSGRYTIKLVALRDASAMDKLEIEAEKKLFAGEVVARDGIEPPTPAFSGPYQWT